MPLTSQTPRPKVLVISQYFWPEGFRINDVVASLVERGCDVTVLTGQPNYPDGKVYPGYHALGSSEETHASGAHIVRIPLIPRGKRSAVRLALNYLSFIASGLMVAPWKLRGRAFDVVFVYGVSPITQAIPGMLMRRTKRAALVVWVQDLWPESLEVTGLVRNRAILAMVGAMTRWIYRHCDRLLVQSRSFVPTVQAMAGTVPVVYHPNPGDLAQSDIASPAASLPVGFNVVFAGNIGSAQSPQTIVKAACLLQDLPDLKFVMVGSGSKLEWMQAETARLGLTNVLFLGRFPAEVMQPILQQAAALLITLGKGDILAQTIPSKLATYLAAGRPIVGALDGEGSDVIAQAGAGMCCAAEDADGLAAAVRSLYHLPPDVRLAMGASARHYFSDNFEPGRLADDLIGQFVIAMEQAGSRTRVL